MKNLNKMMLEAGLSPDETIERYQDESYRFDHDVNHIMVARESGLRSGHEAGTHDGIRDGASLSYRIGGESYSIYSLTDRVREFLENAEIKIPAAPEKPAWLLDVEKYQDSLTLRVDGSCYYYGFGKRPVEPPQEFKKTDLYKSLPRPKGYYGE